VTPCLLSLLLLLLLLLLLHHQQEGRPCWNLESMRL
jgi:hypothetical protein